MANDTSDKAVALKERTRLALDRGVLFVFLVAGSLAIVMLKLSPTPLHLRIGIPVALIVVYALLTISRTRFRLRYDQAGDNCYYMGFIFTLVSLGIALYQVRLETTVQEYGVGVVRDFGLALSTTVVGIICRVSLTQLREDPHDIEEATRRELIEYSRALSGQMRASVAMLVDVRQTTEDRLKNFVFEIAQVVNEHQRRTEELRDSTKTLSDSVNNLATDLASAEIPTGKLRDAAAATIVSINSLNDTLTRANAALSGIETASQKVIESYQKSATEGLKVAAQEERVSATLLEGGAAAADFSTKTRELTATLQSVLSGADAFKGLGDEVRAVTDALRTATRSIGGANSRLSTAEASLASYLASAEVAAKSLSDRVEALIVAHSRLDQLGGTAPTSQAA